MNPPLTGQTVAITGAANGIGKAITAAFREAGCRVLAIDLNEEALRVLKDESPDNTTIAPVDISDYGELKQLAGAQLDGVDHLVCAAAIGSGKTGFPFWNLEPDDWSKVIEVTLMGTVNVMHAFAPALLKGDTQRKSVALLASVAGQIGSQTDPPYSASKAALINFAQCAAKDFAPYGIRVNSISPGMVRTALNESVWAASEAAAAGQSYEDWADEKIRKVSPLGRWQTPEEIAAMAVFLAGEQGKNITGQTLNIDGGQVMHS